MPSFSTVSVDTEGCLRTWLNSLTTSLVGLGQPVNLGFSLELRRSPGSGTYGLLSRIGGLDGFGVEAAADMARISCSIFSTTRKAAAAGAIAYANTLRTISTVQPAMAAFDATIRQVDNLTGPTYIFNPAKALPQYLVDADIYFAQLT